MIKSLWAKITGASILQKAARTTAYTVINFGSSQLIRLLSNLVLTRLLFPEAFGIMALSGLLLTALSQFSDVGIKTSIIRSERGEDQVFLDTAWSLKVVRGVFLFAMAWLLSYPMSILYGDPIFTKIVPMMAIILIVEGLLPTSVDLAYRHMEMGRLTALEIGANLITVISMIFCSWLTGDVWGLAYGTVLGAIGKFILFKIFLPGHGNSFVFERPAMRELLTFGIWIFPSTIATFIAMQSDKFLLGIYVSLETLGIYNIGYFLASFPLMLAQTLGGRVMTSFYRNSPPGESAANFNRIRKLIFVAFGGLSVSIIVLVLIGGWLVAFLYDDRYLEAGVMLVTLTSMHILQIHQIPYQHAVLGLGSSRQYFTLIAVKALAMISCIWLGLEFFGLLGGIIGQGVAFLISYPASLFYAIRMKVWDPLFDIFLFAVAAVITSTAWFLYSDQMQSLIGY